MKKILVPLVVLAIALLVVPLSAQPALADAGGPHVFRFMLSCGGQTIEVVSPSEAAAIAQAVANQTVLVATKIVVTLGSDTFTVTYGPGHGQARGIQGSLQTCTGTDPASGATLTITQFMTPRK